MSNTRFVMFNLLAVMVLLVAGLAFSADTVTEISDAFFNFGDTADFANAAPTMQYIEMSGSRPKSVVAKFDVALPTRAITPAIPIDDKVKMGFTFMVNGATSATVIPDGSLYLFASSQVGVANDTVTSGTTSPVENYVKITDANYNKFGQRWVDLQGYRKIRFQFETTHTAGQFRNNEYQLHINFIKE